MRTILILMCVLFFYTQAFSAVLFEDDFSYTSNWVSAQTVSKSCGGSDVFEYGVPGEWTGGNWVASVFCDNPNNQTYQVNGNDPRGGSGKSLEYWAESKYYWNGNEWTNDWTGGRIVKKLSVSQSQIYYRLFIKYPSEFAWSDDFGHGYHKLMSISSVPAATTDANIWGRGTAYNNIPDMIWTNYSNKNLDHNKHQPDPCPRNFSAPLGYGVDYDTADSLSQITIDGNWHSYEMGVGLNSAPGVEDGFVELYYDGVKIYSLYTIAWVGAVGWSSGKAYTAGHMASNVTPTSLLKGFRPLASHTSGGTEPNWSAAATVGDIVADGNGNQWEYFTDYKWNLIWLLDNIYIGVSSEYEQKFYVDDVVVSTEYIGPNYVIGGSTPHTLKLLPGLAKQTTGTGRFIQ